MAESDKAGRLRGLPGIVWRLLTLVVAGAIVYLFATEWDRWDGEPGAQTTNDAYLQTDLTPLVAKVPGYVSDVPVQDFDRVRAGQVIARIVDNDYRATLAQAEANVELAKAQIGTLRAQRALQNANIEAAQALVAATEATYAQSGRDLARASALLASGSGSTEAVEKARTAHAQLQAQRDQVQAQAAAAQKQAMVLDSQIIQANAAYVAQVANREIARINLGYTVIRAPADGVISQRQVFKGQYLGVGGLVATLAALPHVWVLANYRETQLTHVMVGQQADIRVDTFPSHVLHGHVLAMAPASGAQFALLPPDNATGNFTKIVQRFTVKIAIDDADGLADRLRPGMSVVTSIDARDGSSASGTAP
jgi:membrane fusion protein (multidrug efflux system)